MIPVVDNPPASRFEARLGDDLAFLNYRRHGQTMVLVHTEVPPAFEGRGVGGALARAALDSARDAHLHVIPQCPFVAAYIKRHPEYAPLVLNH